MAPNRCQYCGKAFKTLRVVNHHISLSESCYNEWRKDLSRTENPSPKRQKKDSSTELEEHWEDIDTGIADDFVLPLTSRRASVEKEVNDEERNTYPTSQEERFIESYAGDAGKGLRKSKTRFEDWLENQRGKKKIHGTCSQAKKNGPNQMVSEKCWPEINGRIPKASYCK